MGIDIVVGIFTDRAGDEDDSLGFYADFDRGFEAINALLRSLGLPEHHEPIALAGQSAFHRTATRELYPFKEIVWHVEEQTTLRFPHLLELDAATICLPLLFEAVLELLPPFTSDIRRCGSSYKLYEECRFLAKMLGIYDLIEDGTSIPEVGEYLRDLDQRERDVPFSLISKLLVRRYPLLAENPWMVVGTGACATLYEAAKYSVKHKAALVVSA